MNIDECKLDAQLSEQNEIARLNDDFEILSLIKSVSLLTSEKIEKGADITLAIEGLIGYVKNLIKFTNDTTAPQEFLTAICDIHKHGYKPYTLLEELDSDIADYIDTGLKIRERKLNESN